MLRIMFYFLLFVKNFFVVDDDSGLPAIGIVREQSASRLNFYDDSGLKHLFRHFSLRWQTKTSASGMTVTPLVYLMTMPSYGYGTPP